LFLRVLSAAFFVFFSAAAGAGIVSADLGLFELDLFDLHFALRRLGGGPLAFGHGKLANLIVARLAYIPDVSGPGAGFEVHLEDNVRDTVLDGFEHLLEHS